LVIYTDNTYQLEASGSVFLSGGGFAEVSATSALLRLNTTGVSQAERVLQVGGYSHTLSAMSALSDPVLRVTGLQARIGDALAVSGDLSFERDAASGNLEVLASNASASVRAGDLSAGVRQAQLALVMRDANLANGGVLLEATGAADMALGESVKISATAATVRWNSTNLDASGRAINVAGTAYTYGANLQAGLRTVGVTGASLVLGDFFRVSGDFAFVSDSKTVKLAADTASTPTVNEATTGLDVSLLTLGGKNLNSKLGAASGPQVALTGVEFGLALMSAKNDATRRWARPEGLEVIGWVDGVVDGWSAPAARRQGQDVGQLHYQGAPAAGLSATVKTPDSVQAGSATDCSNLHGPCCRNHARSEFAVQSRYPANPKPLTLNPAPCSQRRRTITNQSSSNNRL
jgi:hypothetical protein